MSDKKGLLDKIKALLFDNAMPTAYKLADGTDVTISLLDVGGDFSMGGSPAPEGTYTLMDGSNVTVDSTGKITAIDAPADMSATEYSLADGTKVTIDKLEVGGAVMQGEQPIANGDYTLEDGSKISVAGGLITTVTPKEAAAKMTKEQVQQLYADVIGAPPTDQVSKLVTCVNALMDYCFGWQIDDPTYNPAEQVQDAQQVADAINVYKQGLTAQFVAQEDKITKQQVAIDKQAETQKQILELMLQLADVPAGDPPVDQKRGVFSSLKPNTKKTAIEKYAEASKRLNDSKINN